MTPIEVEAYRKRAIALLESAKLICQQIDEAGYGFADEAKDYAKMAVEVLDAETTRTIDQRYVEILYQQREDEREAYGDFKRRRIENLGFRL